MNSGSAKPLGALIDGTIPISLSDVTGEASFVIFFCGCNFRCPFCQNWPIVEQANKICSLRCLDDILVEIDSFRNFISYVQVTGGEPTLQIDFVKALFQLTKLMNLKTSLDTNGSNPVAVEDLINGGIVDHVAMDIKTSLNHEKYAKAIGLSAEASKIYVERIIKTLEVVSKLDFLEVRTTYVPNIVCEDDILEIADFLTSYLYGKRHYYVIQQYIPNPNAPEPAYRSGNIMHPQELEKVARKVREKLPNVIVRHMGGVKYL